MDRGEETMVGSSGSDQADGTLQGGTQETRRKRTPGRHGERPSRMEEKMRNSPTLVRAPKFSLSAPIGRELNDELNRRCKVLTTLILEVKPQPRANRILRHPRQPKGNPEGFLVSVENWS